MICIAAFKHTAPRFAVALLLATVVTGAHARDDDDDRDDDHDDDRRSGQFCSATARTVLRACRAETMDDFWIREASCINVSDRSQRRGCREEAREERHEARTLCREQLEARLDVCDLVGEARRDVGFDPEQFVDPRRIGLDVEPNPYFPLLPGLVRRYAGGDETITVTVTDRTKLIDGVECRVVNDVVREDGAVIEDTLDWYAQDLDGNVWYCGEDVRDFETFEGDEPPIPELVSTDGSFKAGRDGDQPGILVPAQPRVGDVYRQEVSLGNAEDVAQVISVTGSAVVPAAMCQGNCLVTRDFTPLEPGIAERKFYAPGIGPILELTAQGERVELVEFVTP